jgi:DNA-binding winged helix-turn-helix (wHTH) protein/rhodanese-related sulfurtransferase/tetratricopeptide (TPR) repeat protein
MDNRVVFAINEILIDLGDEVLRDGLGKTTPLRRQSFAVLRFLLEHADRLVTKEELMTAVWPDTAVTDDSLVQCVHEIRRALGDHRHEFITTVPRRGYRFCLRSGEETARVTDGDPVPLHSVAEGAGSAFPPFTTGRLRRRALPRTTALGLVVVLLVSAVTLWSSIDSGEIVGGDDGLGSIGIPPSDGAGNNSPKLIEDIKSTLFDKQGIDGGLADVSAETPDIRARDALLLGLEYFRRDTEEDTLKAITAFERARDLDPHYGRAYAAIAAAQLRVVRSDWRPTSGASLDESYRSLRWNLARAMERPTALAYSVATEWALETGLKDEALAFSDKAFGIAPHDPDVLLGRAHILNVTGRANEAETALRLAMRLDTDFAPATLRALSAALFNQGKFAGAIETVQRISAQGVANKSDYITLVSSLGHLGRTDGVTDAIRAYNELAAVTGSESMSVQEAQWRWHGDLFGYHRPYLVRLAEGLRKAGMPEGAGADLPLDRYMALVAKKPDGQFSVKGAVAMTALHAGALFDRGVTFIDVRPRAGYASGHVPGAVNLSLVTDLSKEALLKIAATDDEIVFYCGSEYCGHSALAAAKAIAWGYRKVYWLAGGIPAWEAADCPIEVASAR